MWIARERRQTPRVRLSARVFLEAHGVLGHAWAVNLSEGGMLLHGRSVADLAADQRVMVSFRLPEMPQPLESVAQVVGGPRGSRAGLRFIAMAPRRRDELSRFVSATRQRLIDHPE